MTNSEQAKVDVASSVQAKADGAPLEEAKAGEVKADEAKFLRAHLERAEAEWILDEFDIEEEHRPVLKNLRKKLLEAKLKKIDSNLRPQATQAIGEGKFADHVSYFFKFSQQLAKLHAGQDEETSSYCDETGCCDEC